MIFTQSLLRLLVQEKKVDLEEIIEYFSRIGIIDELHVKRSLIKYEYMNRIGQDESGRQIKIDLAVKYDCSISHVGHCIYKHPEIKV